MSHILSPREVIYALARREVPRRAACRSHRTEGTEPLSQSGSTRGVSVRILLCVKAVALLIDDPVFVNEQREMDPDVVDYAPNEWDLAATEEALRLKEQFGGEVTATTYGDANSEVVLRRCLAMGVDHAIRIAGDASDPSSVAQALSEVVRSEAPDLVLCGVQSSDSVQSATGTMLAEFANLPCAAVVKRIEFNDSSETAVVDRELEGGLVDRMEIDLPALMTIQTGINQPRYANLRAIKLAEQREIDIRESSQTGSRAYVITRMQVPESRSHAHMIEGEPREIARRIFEIIGGDFS